MNGVYLKNGSKVTLGDKLNSGGEGAIYNFDKNTVAKIYNFHSLTSEKESKIDLIISKNIKLEGICAPTQSLFDENRKFIGFLMPKADVQKGFELSTTIFQPGLIKHKLPNWSRIELVNLSITILNKIKYLHDLDIIIGDINPQNIIVKDDKTIFIVDVDSFQIDNFPCPVGTIHFTAPEIQNIPSFNGLIRTHEHEYFAVATLLFMIFMIGKTPYSYQGGGNMKENILSMNFSYPLGDEDNYMAPQGMWEFIWSEFSFDLRKAFYEVFKENRRITIVDWLNILNLYLEDLQNGLYQVSIFPNSTEKIIYGRSLNLNKRDVKDNDNNVRNGRTVITTNPKEKNFGILELSTKAVKFLTADFEKVESLGFNFDFFFRESKKTETGRGLDENNFMDLDFFDRCVLPSISNMLKLVKEKKIDVLFSVATAAYRTAVNRDEIITRIRDKCGINVKILSKKEEAISTLTAFAFSKPTQLKIKSSDHVLMIDQGGGSTEITFFQGRNIIDTYSLNLGTTVLKTVLFKESNKETLISKALTDSDKFVNDRIKTYFSSKKLFISKLPGNFSCICVGTAITKSTNKGTNSRQHGTTLTIEQIKSKILEIDILLKNKYIFVTDLMTDLDVTSGSEKSLIYDNLDKILVMRLGLPMFVKIMEGLNLKEIVVSGTGLWYGVFYENLYNLNSL